MKSYSYSSFKDFDNCPRQMNCVRILKNVSRKYDASGPGKAFHKVIDQAIRHDEPTLPSRFRQQNWVLDRIKKIKEKMNSEVFTGVTTSASEAGLAVTVDWEPRQFFSKDAWYCGQVDFLMTRGPLAYITDWKWGKSGYADIDQLYQQAVLVFAAMPEIKTIRADLCFVKEKVMVPAVPLTIKRDTLVDLQSDIVLKAGRIHRASVDNNWPATPNGLCQNHCPLMYQTPGENRPDRCEHSGRMGDE